ncbi:MAG: toll/interleukin-1 receptor domain-containing protein [Verrucomicrobia bacterium]|nr:toll/interleukin-1 receptor domain-containing protein [Verrucomicrobiota bacterium]
MRIMMGYQHDVFLSYLHEKPCGTWVVEHFLPYFQQFLGNALNRPASVFLDRTGIHLGQKWPARLRSALAHSRCLVGVWSPLYFHAEWCQCECAVMLHREAQLGYGTAQNPDGLMIGVKVNDGIHFPGFAQDSQYADFEGYFFDGPAFAQSPLHVEFQKAIVALANDVARIVNGAPKWSSRGQSNGNNGHRWNLYHPVTGRSCIGIHRHAAKPNRGC